MTRQSLSLIYCFCEGVAVRRLWCGLSAELSTVCRPSGDSVVSKRATSPRVGVISRVGDSFSHLSPIQPDSQLHFRVPAADLFPLLLQSAHHILPPTPSDPSVPSALILPPGLPPLSSHTLPSSCLPASLRWKLCQRRLSQTESSASLSSSWHHNTVAE